VKRNSATLRLVPAKRPLLFFFLLALAQCAPYPVFRQHPPQKKKTIAGHTAPTHARKETNALGEVELRPSTDDRYRADSVAAMHDQSKDAAPPVSAGDTVQPRISIAPPSSSPSFHVPCRFIRIALRQNLRRAELTSTGRIDILSSGSDRVSARGDFTFESTSSEKIICRIPQQGVKEYALPCTLHSANAFNVIEFNGAGYRGSMILTAEGRGLFSVINRCDVEDYLRGVVPLEIGNGSEEEVEAIKAQAVAARTYTYKKILERQKQAFDLLPTIADQVYGGVGVEKPQCNRAIGDTRDLVAVFQDSLIYAYYHSTCGGRTANVEDVWDKAGLPYLRSIADQDEKGGAYCAGSPNFTWEESWPVSQLSTIIGRFSRETFPQNPATGRFSSFAVDSRYACGRCRSCKITTANGVVLYGGDKIRFVLRRNMSGFPILRSAVITKVSMFGGNLHVGGRGYGHGIGMCQYGAIGRALAGQSCEHIIKAYYTGVEIRSISAE